MNYKSDLDMFINEIININKNDSLIIPKNEFYQNKNINFIVSKYKYNNKNKSKLYRFSSSLLVLNNKCYLERKNLMDKLNLDKKIFKNLKKCNLKNIKLIGNILVNYFQYKIKSIFLEELIDTALVFDLSIFNLDCDEEIIKRELLNYEMLGENEYFINNKKYLVNEKGQCFLNSVFMNATKKEEDIYCNIFDFDVMEKEMPVDKHVEYCYEVFSIFNKQEKYRKIINNFCSKFDGDLGASFKKIVELSRVHAKKFKKFYESYFPLIRFASLYYSSDAIVKYTERDTSQKIKFDGIVTSGDNEDKIEITTVNYNNEYKKDMKKLNQFDIVNVKCFYADDFEKDFIDKIEQAVCKKAEKKNSYDNTITLVVYVTDVSGLRGSNLRNENYFIEITNYLKKTKFIFKHVFILIEGFYLSNYKVEPQLIQIK